MTGSLVHDVFVQVVDQLVAVGADDLASLFERLVRGLVGHFRMLPELWRMASLLVVVS